MSLMESWKSSWEPSYSPSCIQHIHHGNHAKARRGASLWRCPRLGRRDAAGRTSAGSSLVLCLFSSDLRPVPQQGLGANGRVCWKVTTRYAAWWLSPTIVVNILLIMVNNGYYIIITWLMMEWVRQLGWFVHSQLNGKINNVPNHQPVILDIYITDLGDGHDMTWYLI